jgi:gamma-butyrobetaine dioxygenase
LYPLEWLRSNSIERGAEKMDSSLFEPKLWSGKDVQKKDLVMDYAEFMDKSQDGDAALYKFLTLLKDSGLAFIQNVPGNDLQVESIASRIGEIRESFYGRSWDVKNAVDAKNIAYTSLYLGLHMDLM